MLSSWPPGRREQVFMIGGVVTMTVGTTVLGHPALDVSGLSPGEAVIGLAFSIVALVGSGAAVGLLASTLFSVESAVITPRELHRRGVGALAGVTLVILVILLLEVTLHGLAAGEAVVRGDAPGAALGVLAAWTGTATALAVTCMVLIGMVISEVAQLVVVGALPWRDRRPVVIIRLLERAADRHLLRRVGTTYQFRHAEVQEWLRAPAE